jgi:NAD-dependent deacetylase
MSEIKERLYAGEDVPDCEACHGILKPDIVLFGEALPDEVFSEAAHRAEQCDLFIVVGSSLVVYPAALIPGYAVDAGAELVIVNLSETPMDERATIIIRARAGEAMSRIMQKLAEKSSG